MNPPKVKSIFTFPTKMLANIFDIYGNQIVA